VNFFGGPDDGYFHRWTFTFGCWVSFDEPMFHPPFNSLQLLFLLGVMYQKHKRQSHTTSLVFICEVLWQPTCTLFCNPDHGQCCAHYPAEHTALRKCWWASGTRPLWQEFLHKIYCYL
jgi:hypothetical protein